MKTVAEVLSVDQMLDHNEDDGRWYCKREGCDEHYATRLAGLSHWKKHKNEDTVRARGDSDGDGRKSTTDESDEPDTPRPPLPPPGFRPKVAGGLYPWLMMAGMAVAQRNAYDGAVIQAGAPGLIEALDEVAENNDQLYRALQAVSAMDSPGVKLAVAVGAILIPMMANHRPESGMLRSATRTLQFIPGTNIPLLPVREGHEDEDAQADTVMQQAADFMAGMTEEQQEQMAAQMQEIPPEVLAQMMQDTAPIFGGMAHPDEVHSVVDGGQSEADDGPPTS